MTDKRHFWLSPMAIAQGLISFHLDAGLPLKKLRLVLQPSLLLFS